MHKLKAYLQNKVQQCLELILYKKNKKANVLNWAQGKILWLSEISFMYSLFNKYLLSTYCMWTNALSAGAMEKNANKFLSFRELTF